MLIKMPYNNNLTYTFGIIYMNMLLISLFWPIARAERVFWESL